MKRIVIVLVLLIMFPATSAVYADNSGKKTKKHYQEHQIEKRKNSHPGDRGNHYGWYNKKHPPEGWRDQVSRGKRIGTDLSVYLEDVPREIVRTLPPLPTGVSYKRIENDIIKFHNANMEILEVFRDFGVPVPVLPKIK